MPNDMDGELSFILTDYVYCQTNHIGGVMVIVLSSIVGAEANTIK